MITFDKDRIYTWGRLRWYFKWSEEYLYHLHAKDYDYKDQWSVMLPILVRAMVASDDRLFVLGPEELMRHLFIQSPVYGTRSSTVLTISRQGRVYFEERSFSPGAEETNRAVYEFDIC